MDLSAVRAGLAGVDYGDDVDAKPYIPDSIVPVTVAVGRMQLTYNRTYGGLVEVVITLHAFASRADTWQGQEDLLPLMSEDGLKAAVEADRTLGGACQELRVESADGPGLVDVAGQQYWGSSWTVRVWG